jgi:hypothetical protein
MAVVLPIVSEFDGRGIKKAIAQFKQLETTSEKAQFAIKKAAVPAGIAVAALGGFLVNAAKGAEEARQANQRLGNVLDSMGFGEATDRVSAYAESLEKTIAVDADVIKATQTKLATFGKLTQSVNEAGGAFDRATLAALDMAAAGFGSAETNAVALGKALEDPIKGITALAKSGVTFTEQEKEKIKTLVESNKLLEAQDMVLAAIEKQVGGTSEASASSFDKMKFALAGISDTFGELVLPYIDKFAVRIGWGVGFCAGKRKTGRNPCAHYWRFSSCRACGERCNEGVPGNTCACKGCTICPEPCDVGEPDRACGYCDCSIDRRARFS